MLFEISGPGFNHRKQFPGSCRDSFCVPFLILQGLLRTERVL